MPDLCSDLRPESIDPSPDGLVADDNAPGGEQIPHIPQAHREPIIGPYGIRNHLARITKPVKVGADGIEIIRSRYDYSMPQSS
jgi:hypothetical protein